MCLRNSHVLVIHKRTRLPTSGLEKWIWPGLFRIVGKVDLARIVRIVPDLARIVPDCSGPDCSDCLRILRVNVVQD
jgi:hypothetical protein